MTEPHTYGRHINKDNNNDEDMCMDSCGDRLHVLDLGIEEDDK